MSSLSGGVTLYAWSGPSPTEVTAKSVLEVFESSESIDWFGKKLFLESRQTAVGFIKEGQWVLEASGDDWGCRRAHDLLKVFTEKTWNCGIMLVSSIEYDHPTEHFYDINYGRCEIEDCEWESDSAQKKLEPWTHMLERAAKRYSLEEFKEIPDELKF